MVTERREKKCVSCGKNLSFWEGVHITSEHEQLRKWGYHVGDYICAQCKQERADKEAKKELKK